jgi:diguanylate cyclase (GGDEF)-like protein
VKLGAGSVASKARWPRAIGARSGLDPDRVPALVEAEPGVLRLIVPLAVLAAVAILVWVSCGWVLAVRADDALEAGRRQALHGALDALQAVAIDPKHIDASVVRMLERASGLRGLRLDSEPATDGSALQSLVDGSGRIVGWWSWQADRPATETMERLVPLAVTGAFAMFGFGGLTMWQLGRLGRKLARSEHDVRKLSDEDALTGLPNRNHVVRLLDQALAMRLDTDVVGFAVIDIDGFDDIHDGTDADGADCLIVEIANRLHRALPATVTIGRIDGEEFSLIIPAPDMASVIAVAETARDTTSRALWLDHVMQVSACAGIAIAPHDGAGSDDLVRRAALALRTAKRRGRGQLVTFASELEVDSDEQRFIRRELAGALAARQFEVHYQPIVSASDGTIVGVEALLRWEHAVRGFIPPSLFVPVAEQAGLMGKLGEFVLRRALSDAVRWPTLYVAVNLSPMQVRDRNFVALVKDVLKETRITPSRVVLEITEGVLIEDQDEAKSRLEDLRTLGVRLALDDFGSGYSSLTYLQRLPFDKLKIDRGFVAALDQSANTGVIIQAIVSLGRALGLSVLIEGVETEEQRVLLRLAGCDEMQGYLFARPAPRHAIDRLLADTPVIGSPAGRPQAAKVEVATGRN